MSPLVLSIMVGVGVVGVLGALGLLLSGSKGTVAEQRLDGLAGRARSKPGAAGALMRAPAVQLGSSNDWLGRVFSVEKLNRLYEQADVGLAFKHFLMVAGGLAVGGAAAGFALGMPRLLAPLGGLFLGVTPFLWLVLRKRKRVKQFVAQMPDALELVGRALRAGHGLASGLDMVREEMPPPISIEFGRIFEEQNLGIPIEEALRGLSERVPAMDVRFFVTAVIIQRGSGGDLAEVLDKIGRLVRERFQILGQVQALTGEGRLSGVVLLAMPPGLLAFIYTTNPGYVGLLFSTSIGTKMLMITGVLQVLGALVIKKIVTIKV